jgi:hypothetical protein
MGSRSLGEGGRGWAAGEGPLSNRPMGGRGWAAGEGPLSS